MTAKIPAPSDVAIITVSYNSSAQLADFLDCAVKSVAAPNQIFVVDNNSSDIGVTEKLTKNLGINLLKLDKNVGYGSAVNKAVPVLPTDFTTLLVCNPDIELNPETVSVLRSAVQDSKVGVVGPRIYNEDGSVYPSARSIPSIRNGVGHALFARIWKNNPWSMSYLSDAHLQTETVTTDWVSGACLAIRLELFSQIGGFDDKYFMYFEDVELGFRLRNLGYLNQYLPGVSITHIGGVSTKSSKKIMMKVHHESASLFFSQSHPGILWLPLRFAVKIGLKIRFGIIQMFI